MQYPCCHYCCVVDDYTNKEPQIIQIDLLEKLKNRIEHLDEAWDVAIGRAIESDIIDFSLEGSWRFGFVSPEGIIMNRNQFPRFIKSDSATTWQIDGTEFTPALWFGRENDLPMARWMITPQTTTDDLEFWFYEDEEDIMTSIVDSFDIISMWYLFECRFEVPNIADIREKCPILIGENDSQEVITNKINSFFLSQYAVS